MGEILTAIALTVALPLLLNELTDSLPWLAEKIIRKAARRIDSTSRSRYQDEWIAELEHACQRKGKITVFLWALRVWLSRRETAVEASKVAAAERDTERAALTDVIGAAAVDQYVRALNKLRSDDRDILIARLEKGLSYESIARMRGNSSRAAVRMAVSRALARLVSLMGESTLHRPGSSEPDSSRPR
jgi:DNA-directed RNA polymerase specialized sigma24 family protein